VTDAAGPTNPALAETWRKYRGWAARARAIRNDLDRWRLRALVLTVLGAALATLAAQLQAWFPADQGGSGGAGVLGRVLSAVSAVAMALAAYVGRSVLDPAVERQWLRARALAESCKAEAYRFATRVSPYEGADAGPKLLGKLQQLLASGADVPAVEVDPNEAAKGLPAYPLLVEEYVIQRVRDQIDRFYRPRATLNERRAAVCALWVQGLTGIAAVLGAIGAVHGGGVEAWVATLGTVATAVGAFALGQRYQRLAATYRVTADRLAVRLALWELAQQGQAERAADAALVLDAEAIMAAENEAWLAEFLKDPSAPATAAGA
jgi:hypothetical protein